MTTLEMQVQGAPSPTKPQSELTNWDDFDFSCLAACRVTVVIINSVIMVRFEEPKVFVFVIVGLLLSLFVKWFAMRELNPRVSMSAFSLICQNLSNQCFKFQYYSFTCCKTMLACVPHWFCSVFGTRNRNQLWYVVTTVLYHLRDVHSVFPSFDKKAWPLFAHLNFAWLFKLTMSAFFFSLDLDLVLRWSSFLLYVVPAAATFPNLMQCPPRTQAINQTLPTCLIHFSTRKLGYLFTYLILSTSRKFSFYKACWSGDNMPSYVYGSALNVVWSLRRMLGRMSKQGNSRWLLGHTATNLHKSLHSYRKNWMPVSKC